MKKDIGHLSKLALILSALLRSGPCPAQDAARPTALALSISAPKTTLKVGEPIVLKIALTNTSDHNVPATHIPRGDGEVTREADIKVYDNL
jgi:hypothetical protein